MIIIKRIFYVGLLITLTRTIHAQTGDSTRMTSFFTGVITATNNGVSLIPSFTLGKPALLFDLSMGRGRWSFDPMLRFGMNGKPWAFIFWGRYKVFNHAKFKMSVGAHPSFVFRDVDVTGTSGVEAHYLIAQRYFAWEVTPVYYPHPQIGLGFNYLGAVGLTRDLVQNTTFLALRIIMPHIALSSKTYLSFVPQAFYLKMEDLDGTYGSAAIGLAQSPWPFSISTILSKKINSRLAGKDFIWNIQFNFHLNNKYYRI